MFSESHGFVGLPAWPWLGFGFPKPQARPKPSKSREGPAWPGLFGPGLARLTASGRARHSTTVPPPPPPPPPLLPSTTSLQCDDHDDHNHEHQHDGHHLHEHDNDGCSLTFYLHYPESGGYERVRTRICRFRTGMFFFSFSSYTFYDS